ncbi:MAG: TIGR01777 family oxidoreductase [Chthoniobacteraceae bacterium]
MRIALTGASGFLGRSIIRAAHTRGHETVAFSRAPARGVEGAIETRQFEFSSPPDFSGCEAVIHLAGEPIFGLWTRARRREIMVSRVRGTRRVIEGIARAQEKPEVLVCASAVGYYADAGDTELTETSPLGTDLLAATCAAWEIEAAQASGVRIVHLRIAPVLGRGGGMLGAMAPIFRCGLGGRLGSGQQWMPWIHVEDLARLALFAIEDMSVSGPVNACAPWPVRNADFARTLARVLDRPAFCHVPAWAVRFALRGLGRELLASKRVVPAAATGHGFAFRFPDLEPALRDVL